MTDVLHGSPRIVEQSWQHAREAVDRIAGP
jgi:hypothetical protein